MSAPVGRRCAASRRRARRRVRRRAPRRRPPRSPWACTTSAPPTSRPSSRTARASRAGCGRSESSSGTTAVATSCSAKWASTVAGQATTTWWPAPGSDPTSPCDVVPDPAGTRAEHDEHPHAWLPPRRRDLPRWRTCDIISRSPIDSATTPTTRATAPAASPDEQRLGQARRGCGRGSTRSPTATASGHRDDERPRGAAGALGSTSAPQVRAHEQHQRDAGQRHAQRRGEPQPAQGRRRALPAGEHDERQQGRDAPAEGRGDAGIGRPAAHVAARGSAAR